MVKGATTVGARRSRWSESSEDIRALRKGVNDGPLGVALESQPLLAASLGASEVLNDTSGNFRLIKRGSNNCGRDDVAAALVLAVGAFDRAERRPPGTAHVVV